MKVLEGAFRLFLNSSYDGVSTSDIEKEIGMTRGAIYYTYKSKLELFWGVIDHFVLHKQDIYHKTGFTLRAAKWISLKEYIETYVHGARNTIESMEAYVNNDNNGYGGYFNLLYQARRLYPDFDQKIYDTFFKEYSFIKAVVQNAIETKEIKPLDADIVAHHFRYIFIGYAFEESFHGNFSADNVKNLLMNYYALLKL